MKTKTIVNWGGILHCIEVSDGTTEPAGVRVFRCDNDGNQNTNDYREVFVDAHEMTKDREWTPEDILLVHVYRNSKPVARGNNRNGETEDPNEEGVPVTLQLHYNEIVLSNDGNATLKATNDVKLDVDSAG